jgi:hypothetical protein
MQKTAKADSSTGTGGFAEANNNNWEDGNVKTDGITKAAVYANADRHVLADGISYDEGSSISLAELTKNSEIKNLTAAVEVPQRQLSRKSSRGYAQEDIELVLAKLGLIKVQRAIIPNSVKKIVFARDQYCQFKNSMTQKVCGSRYCLQIDHIKCREFGGSNDPSNLRLLCANHHRYRHK